MNIWKIPPYSHKIFALFQLPYEIILRIKWSWQRIKYGYCDKDLWNMDLYLLNLISEMLRGFAEVSHGYPDGYTRESWIAELTKQAAAFRGLYNDYYNLYFVQDMDLAKENRKRCFDNLLSIFDSLWD